MEAITYAGLTTTLIGIVGWLLANKDAKQGGDIDLLFRKHDADVDALNSLRVEIAKEHYLKHELDSRFQSLEFAFKDGMKELGGKFDRLTEILVENMRSNERRP